MMPIFHSGHFRVFWDVLLDAADRFDSKPSDDNEIVIISPWISDVTTSRSGWSDASIASAFNIDTGNLESLSDILGKLVERGYSVSVVTLSTVGKWLPKATNKHLDLERNFMEKIRSKGVSCFVRNNVHMKYVKTPFAIFAGSINISFNGLSGRNQESASLYYSDTNQQEFRQAKNAIENTLVGSKDYFSPRIPITSWKPPIFHASSPTGNSNSFSSGNIELVYYPELGDDYPDMVADGFLPIGRIAGGADSIDKLLSCKAQFGNLIVRVALKTIDMLADETISGFKEIQILERIYDGEIPCDDNPDSPESLPNLDCIRDLLLSTETSTIEYINSRLGLINDPAAAQTWRNNVSQIMDGMSIISDKLAVETPTVSEEDVTLLNNLVSRFDSGDM